MTTQATVIHHCPVCGFDGPFDEFLSRGPVQCPDCGSLERHRKQALYLRNFTDLFSTDAPLSVLHIAPEPGFSRLFRGRPNINYVAADLDPRKRGGNADNPIIPADLTSLPFADGSFDVIVCSHVLEHIPADDDAMDELHRVLAPTGMAILDVPLSGGEETYEDWTITTDQGRTAAFGQYDHVRLYGQDYLTKLRHAGIDAEEKDNFWPEQSNENSQLGRWSIVVASRGTPSPAAVRPPHNRPYAEGQPTMEQPTMEQEAVSLGEKHDSELGYWQRQFVNEGNTFQNGWYESMMVAIAEADDASYFDGKIVADFGCGPRGSLAWCKGASMTIGIDVLADIYAEQFEPALRGHGMTYVRSTETFIPMPDEFVDVMITINSLDHVDNLADMAEELVRVLKPGGLFLGSFNLEEPANVAEPQQLNEEVLQDALFKHLDVQNVRITDQHEGFANRYEPFLSGMELTYTKGEEGILWMRGTKK